MEKMLKMEPILRALFLGLCCLTSFCYAAGDVKINETELDCRMRELALEYAEKIQYWRDPVDAIFQEIHDALELESKCHITRANKRHKTKTKPSLLSHNDSLPVPSTATKKRRLRKLPPYCNRKQKCVFVAIDGSPNGGGSLSSPFQSVHQALALSRTMEKPLTIVLGGGIHSLMEPLQLGPQDAGLRLRGQGSGGTSWLSGGISIPKETTHWEALSTNSSILVADLSDLLAGRELPPVASLFTTMPHRRYIRARYPNMDPEVSTSHNNWFRSEPSVVEWTKPPKGQPPTFDYIDFSTNPPPNVPIKNDSTMVGYNIYASGHGGVCETLWGPQADSYWCSNASAGGWAGVDQQAAISGQLQIPSGLTYNKTDDIIGSRMAKYENASGGLVYAWHTQGWAMHMFEIEAHSKAGASMTFKQGGGKQGGRNWQACGQINAAWCGQKQDPPDDSDSRLLGGPWLIENILEELDQPGEFYFDFETKKLYVIPNGTVAVDDLDFRFALHDTIINIESSTDIYISNLGFRDSAATFMGDWSAPSGGDWSLHRGGAIFIENSDNVRIKNNFFERLDGNAIFLSRRVRGTRIIKNTFEWLGESAIATWGQTEKYNATGNLFPMHTLISGNMMRELGIYEKQSSAVGLAKSAFTKINNNIMFNMPRAAVNFNDGMGGGDIMVDNLLFNTCRESGDHGPVNSWDRQPYLTTLRYGEPSFTPVIRTISKNFIFANYGAAQGVDNDDGSSWFHIRGNVWYDSEGFKMDFGGTDSIYEDNLIITYPHRSGQNCIGFGSFFEGHGDIVRRNKCIVPADDRPSIFVTHCDHMTAALYHNEYFSPNGTVLVECEFNSNNVYTLEAAQEKYGLEVGSTASVTPTIAEILKWSREILW